MNIALSFGIIIFCVICNVDGNSLLMKVRDEVHVRNADFQSYEADRNENLLQGKDIQGNELLL